MAWVVTTVPRLATGPIGEPVGSADPGPSALTERGSLQSSPDLIETEASKGKACKGDNKGQDRCRFSDERCQALHVFRVAVGPWKDGLVVGSPYGAKGAWSC